MKLLFLVVLFSLIAHSWGFSIQWTAGNITYKKSSDGRFDYRKTQIFDFAGGVGWTSYLLKEKTNPIAGSAYFTTGFGPTGWIGNFAGSTVNWGVDLVWTNFSAVGANNFIAQQWYSLTTDRDGREVIYLKDLQWVLDSVPQGDGLFGAIFVGTTPKHPEMVVNVGYYMSNVKGRIQLNFQGPKRPVTAFQINTLMQVFAYPFNNLNPTPDTFLYIKSLIYVPTQSKVTRTFNRGNLQVGTDTKGVFYEAASVAAIEGVTKGATQLSNPFEKEANLTDSGFDQTIVDIFNQLYGTDVETISVSYSYRKASSIVAYTAFGAGEVPSEDVLIVSIKVVATLVGLIGLLLILFQL